MVKRDKFVTGLRRGYIRIDDRQETPIAVIPERRQLDRIHGNTGFRRAMEQFLDSGCTHYTMADLQSNNSKQFCYSVYYGYK